MRTREVRWRAPPPARRATLPSPCRDTRPLSPAVCRCSRRRAAPRPHASARDIGRTAAAATVAVDAAAAVAAPRRAAHRAPHRAWCHHCRSSEPPPRCWSSQSRRARHGVQIVRRLSFRHPSSRAARASHADTRAARRTPFLAFIRICIRNVRFRRGNRNVVVVAIVVIVVVAFRGISWWVVFDGEV